jgi:hypothetical protein
MDITITRRRFLVSLGKLKIHRRFVRHFIEAYFYQLCEQSYTKIIDGLEPIKQVADDMFLSGLKTALDDLQKERVMDERLHLPFTWYNEVVDSLTDELFPISGHVCKHEKLHGLAEDKFVSCQTCSENFGWYCPKSPDKQCHYYTFEFPEGRGILLLNGEIMLRPDADQTMESSDGCMFCHQPQERK